MSFLHVQHAQSYQLSTDESSSTPKLNFLQIQNLDLSEHKRKWRLLFKVPPSTKALEAIYNELQQSKSALTLENKEQLLLQCILINLQAPIDLKLSSEQWTLVSELMPTCRTPQELAIMSKQFINQSAYNNPWSEEEDQLLLNIILSYQKLRKGNKWSRIAQDLNAQDFNRTPKQCRERWGNKLDPTINRDEWSEAEDLYFLQLLLQYGRKWADLALRLSAITDNKKRTEFSLKHRFKKLMACQNDSEFSSGHKQMISSDWNSKEANKLLAKISSLEQSKLKKQENTFFLRPFNKQVKLNNSCRLVIVQGQSKEEIDLSILFNEMNQRFLQGFF